MEPVSLASGIAGLLSLSIELIKVIGGYVGGVKNCSRGVKDLLEKLETLNGVLRQLSDFLLTEKPKGTFDRASTLFSATNACKEKLQSISDNLKKHTQGGRFSKCVEKLKWPFTEAENLQAIETLHGYVQTFHFSLTIEGCSLLSKTSDEASKTLRKQLETHDIVTEASKQISAILMTIDTFSDVSKKLSVISHTVMNLQKDSKQEKHRDAVLEWLSPFTFEGRHDAIRTLLQPNTGLWFFETEEFKEWLDGDTNPVLWCPGIPGAGKSVMMSSIVDYLAVSCSAQNTGLAYLYCNYNDTNIQTSVNLFSSFIRQLAGKLPALPSEIEDFYESHRRDSPRLTVIDYLKLLLSLSRRFTKTFLLVDALDEGPNNDGFTDWKLLLSTVQEAGSPIKLLVTSRFQDDIEQIFRASPKVEIRASNKDVREYIRFRVAKNSSLAGFTTSYPNLQEEIITTVSDKVDGMFLLACLQLDHLKDQTSARNVRKALGNMPEKLTDTYNDTLSRIRTQCKERSELAIRVLSWIYHARRPLKEKELCHALAVEPGDDHLHEDGLQSVELLLGVCGGLVSLDEKSGTIRFVHYSIQEYLTSIHDQLFTEPEFDIAQTCLTYLLFSKFTGAFEDRSSFPRRSKILSAFNRRLKFFAQNPFFLYASRNWTYHLQRGSESKLLDLTLKYVKHQGRTTAAEWSHPAITLLQHTSNFTPLHFAAGVGLESVVRALVEEGADVDTLDSNSESPLFWALRNGHNSIFQFLVDKGASTWVLSEDGTVRDIMTGLARGKQSDLPAAKMLCKRGLGDSLGPQQNALLHPFVLAQALEGGKEAVMKMLLDNGLNRSEAVTPYVLPTTIKHRSDHLVRLNLARVIEIDIDTKIGTSRYESASTIKAVILKDVPAVLQKFIDTAIRKRQGGTAISLASNGEAATRGNPNQGQLSRGLTRTHNISLILGLSFLICFFLFLSPGRVSFLFNIYSPF